MKNTKKDDLKKIKKDNKKPSAIYFIIFIAIILNLITAWFSVGYFQWDEHFQTIEFMNQKLSHLNANQLPWEFAYQIRSWLQPCFYLISLYFFKLFGIENTFSYAFLFRLESVALSLIAQIMFIKHFNADNKFKDTVIPYFIVLFFWLNIYTNCRTSSETLSAVFLLFSALLTAKIVALEYKNLIFKKIHRLNISFDLKLMFLLGVCLGLAFGFRYQTACFAFGIGLWFILFVKKSIKPCMIMASGFFLVVVLNVILDSICYDRYPTFSFINYFHANYSGPGATDFSKDPWFFYIQTAYNQFHIMSFILVSVLFVLAIYSFMNHPVILGSLCFIIVHFFIGHKELRFLFPMFPLLISLGGIAFQNVVIKNTNLRQILVFALMAVYSFTFYPLMKVLFSPSEPDILNLEILQKYAKKYSLHTYYSRTRDIQHWKDTLVYYFYDKNYPLNYQHYENMNELKTLRESPKLIFLAEYGPEDIDSYLKNECTVLYTNDADELPQYLSKYPNIIYENYYNRPPPVILLCK